MTDAVRPEAKVRMPNGDYFAVALALLFCVLQCECCSSLLNVIFTVCAFSRVPNFEVLWLLWMSVAKLSI